MEDKPEPTFDRPDLGRRRFARGGMAASVVLGSLASKPVLGSSVSTYCSVSGQMSGNLSRRLPEGVSCSDSGDSLADWVAPTLSGWPSAIKRGEALGNSGKFVNGDAFNGFQVDNTALASAFYVSTNGKNLVSHAYAGDKPQVATMWDVLTLIPATTGGISAELDRLGKATVVSLLNAYKYAGYPVWPERIVTMFNATWNGGSYVVGGFHWSQLKVTDYLESLYSA